MCAKPILYERKKINNPGSSKFLPTYQATNKGFFIYECVRIPHADDHWSVINIISVTRGGGGYFCDEFLRAITSYLVRWARVKT